MPPRSKEVPRGETAQYKRLDSGIPGAWLVDVDMIQDNGRWYARLWNDKCVFPTGVESCSECGEERKIIGVPASPWCLSLSTFVTRYKPTAPIPKLGEPKDA